MDHPQTAIERLRVYLGISDGISVSETNAQNNRKFPKGIDFLGEGTDGVVAQKPGKIVVKAFEKKPAFENELECYQRLGKKNVTDNDTDNVTRIAIFSVPQLLGHDPELWIIEMTAVEPPYLLDFGKVYFDDALQNDEGLKYWQSALHQGKQLFDEQWPTVLQALIILRNIHGIWYVDARPPNICFGYDLPERDETSSEIDYSDYEDPSEDS